MVVAVGPSKFYGISLPRPRIYTDVKFNAERVDSPVPFLDALLSWADEAHWSMGGLSFKRLRLRGRIEGNIQKLKKEKEKIVKKKNISSTPITRSKGESLSDGVRKRGNLVDTPLLAPISKKRRYISKFIDEDQDDESDCQEEEIKSRGSKRRRLVKKLGDDFELVASEKGKSKRGPLQDPGNGRVSESVASRTRSTRCMILEEEEEDESDHDVKSKAKKAAKTGTKSPKINEEISCSMPSNETRSSPRLKQKSS